MNSSALAPVHPQGLPATPVTDQFPVFLPGSARDAFSDCPRSIPYDRLATIPPQRVLYNHGAPLEVLAQRGGLDPREIQALFSGLKLTVGVGISMLEGVEFVQRLAQGHPPSAAAWVEPARKPDRPTYPAQVAPSLPQVAPTETAVIAPTPPHHISKPSEALIEIDPAKPPEGLRAGPRSAETYAKVMRQLGPATIRDICRYSGASKGAVTIFLAKHPHLVASSGSGSGTKGRLWTWIGGIAPVEPEHKPTDHIPVVPAPEPGPLGTIQAQVDLTVDEDLAPLLAPPEPPPAIAPIQAILADDTVVMVPKRLLAGMINGPCRANGIQAMIDFARRTLHVRK
jgi:hypothetical protein